MENSSKDTVIEDISCLFIVTIENQEGKHITDLKDADWYSEKWDVKQISMKIKSLLVMMMLTTMEQQW